jgi:hypothetical protein
MSWSLVYLRVIYISSLITDLLLRLLIPLYNRRLQNASSNSPRETKVSGGLAFVFINLSSFLILTHFFYLEPRNMKVETGVEII